MQCQWKNVSWVKSALLTTGSIWRRRSILICDHVVRCYSPQPPDWLGGKNQLIKSGRWDFPEHAQTFEEKMRSNFLFSYLLLSTLRRSFTIADLLLQTTSNVLQEQVRWVKLQFPGLKS